MTDIKLTISILVSGREETTKKCLQSLHDIRQRIATELILVDTGCSARFHEWLKTQADKVITFEWCKDFAKARNAGLKQAKGEWFLYLDDDEWFEDTAALVDFLQSDVSKEYEQAVYKVRNYQDKEGTRYTEEWVSRMIRLHPETHFEGKVHEYLTPSVGRCKKLDMYAHHYGYAFESEEARKAHFERNAALLQALIEEEPNNLKWRIQMIQECANLGAVERLYLEGERMLEVMQYADTPFINLCRGVAYVAILMSETARGSYSDMKQSAWQYLQNERNPKLVMCALYWYLLYAAVQTQDIVLQAEAAGKFIRLYREYRDIPKEEQQQIIEESMPLIKDVMTDKNYKSAQLLNAVALTQQGKMDEIAKEDIQEICKDLEAQFKDNGEFLFVPDEYWLLGEAGVIPMEEMILSLPISQWMAMTSVLEEGKSPERWGRAEKTLQRICTREDLRYIYFDRKSINSRILLMDEQELCDDEQMRGMLEEFAICNIRYANSIYTEEALSGDMDILEEECRAAIWIRRMLECDANDWSGQLENLKQAAIAWPRLGAIAKQYAALIAEQQERQSKQAKQAEDELGKMAADVKRQVITMTENGMYAEALEIVKQLRQMLPEDEDFIYLEQELKNVLA